MQKITTPVNQEVMALLMAEHIVSDLTLGKMAHLFQDTAQQIQGQVYIATITFVINVKR